MSLDGVRWGSFVIGDMFKIVSGRCSNAGNLERDDKGVPYVGATNRNNGVLDFVKPVDGLIMKGNCIAFVKQGEGSVGYAVYKHEDFIAATSIAVGYAPFINKYTGIFITTVADKVRGKYNYNYPRSESRLKKEIIQLPINDAGQPDYSLMERYIRAVESRLLREYVVHIKRKLRMPPPRNYLVFVVGNGGASICVMYSLLFSAENASKPTTIYRAMSLMSHRLLSTTESMTSSVTLTA